MFTEATFEKAAFFTSQVFLLRRQIKKASAAFQPLIFIVHLTLQQQRATTIVTDIYNFMPSFFYRIRHRLVLSFSFIFYFLQADELSTFYTNLNVFPVYIQLCIRLWAYLYFCSYLRVV